MSLLRTSSRLFPGPVPFYKPCAPAIRRVGGPSHSQTTTTRLPWAHQTRLSSSNDKGSGQDDDPYKVLGVPSNIPQSKIKSAYYAQAKKLHPDASKRKNTSKFLKVSRPKPGPPCCERTSPINEEAFRHSFKTLTKSFQPPKRGKSTMMRCSNAKELRSELEMQLRYDKLMRCSSAKELCSGLEVQLRYDKRRNQKYSQGRTQHTRSG